MKRLLFKFHYPKILLLLLSVTVSYYLFTLPPLSSFISSFNEGGSYAATFIAGVLFSIGFTTPFAVGFFVIFNPPSPILFSVIAASGSVVGDYFLFKLIRFSFMDEFNRLKKTLIVRESEYFISHYISSPLRAAFLYAIAGFMIASPLPDEVGVALIAGLSSIKTTWFIAISFVLKFSAILILFAMF